MRDIVFDLDGTLINSQKCIFAIYEKLFDRIGLPLPPEDVMKTFIGPPVEVVLKKYVPEEKIDECCALFRTLYKKQDLKATNEVYEGVESMLRVLCAHGKRLFVASTKNEYYANLIPEIVGIKKYFTAIYGSRSEIGRLSKKQVLEDLFREQNIDKTDCVLIGDTHYDAEGATEFGIPTAIVRYGFGDERKLKEYPIVAYFDTPEDVAEYYKEK